MRNPNEQYDRLHDHMTAIARERDGLQIRIMTLLSKIEQLTDDLYLAHEALRREMP